MKLPADVRHRLNLHARKGGKITRRRQVKLAESFAAWCGCDPRQIGKRHVWQYFEAHGHLAPTTKRDHWYAIRLLWQAMGRVGDPPRPPSALS